MKAYRFLLLFIILLVILYAASDFVESGIAKNTTNPDDQCDYEPAPSFFWEGELDPNEFSSWNIIGMHPDFSADFAWVYVKNPDERSSIKIVALGINFDGTMYGYRYFKEGMGYEYMWNSRQNKFIGGRLSEMEIRECRKCHEREIVLQQNI